MRLLRLLIIAALAIIAGAYVLLTAVYTIGMIAGLADSGMEVKFDRPDPSLVADYGNGLTPAQRESFYHLSQGSEIMPWFWLTAIDAADSDKPFVENLKRYGLLPDPGRADGLPVGLTVASNPFTFGMDFVGVNCAACHVGELRHDGKAVRVDGAPNMFNLQLFYSDAIDAVMASSPISHPAKFWRALKRLGRQDYARYGIAAPFVRPATLVAAGADGLMHRDRVNARLELLKVIDKAKEQRDKVHPTSGFGRLDAFDGTRNFLLTRLRPADSEGFEVNTKNMVALNAPVKFPWLWSLKESAPGPMEAYLAKPETFPRVQGFKDYDWLEWTGNTNTVMERNITETLGAGATVVLDPKSPSLFESSIPVRNMHALEWLAYYIDPPKWPAEIFGPINSDLAAQGRQVFETHCAGCHEYADKDRTESGLIHLRGKSPDFTKTDPTVARTIACPVPDVGALKVTPTSYSVAESEQLKGCAGVPAGQAFTGNSFAGTVHVAVDSIKQKAFAAEGIGEAEQRAMEDYAQRGADTWRDTLIETKPPDGPYSPRPLHGIWAAAPYLHNGSVPTLHDLLLPPGQRTPKFALGARDYDPANLGFVVSAKCEPQDCLVDTTLNDYGNSNSGHVFGTEMSESERMALLEYLKTY